MVTGMLIADVSILTCRLLNW